MAVEVERKFLVESFEPSSPGTQLRQGYISIDGDVEVRVRDQAGECTLTIKRGGGLERVEVERPLDPSEFEQLWPASADRRIEKVRHEVEHGAVTIEVDVFAGALDGLVVAEVEFPDAESATGWTPPRWFGRELTGVDGWSNAALARQGRPDARN